MILLIKAFVLYHKKNNKKRHITILFIQRALVGAGILPSSPFEGGLMRYSPFRQAKHKKTLTINLSNYKITYIFNAVV